MKTCIKCLVCKSIDGFYLYPSTQRYKNTCKSCIKVYRDAYHQKNKQKVCQASKEYNRKHPDRQRNAYFKRAYNIDIIQYNLMLTNQDNKCKICYDSNTSYGRRLEVDHNHITGKVRGLLCHKCNKALGLLKVDVDLSIIKNVLRYIGE